jgi:hypothetical protein
MGEPPDLRALPWLCAACWKSVTEAEIEHIRELTELNPF